MTDDQKNRDSELFEKPNEKVVSSRGDRSTSRIEVEDVDATTELYLAAQNDPDDELLTAFLDGELTDKENADVNRRLESEPELAARLEKLRSVGQLVESLEPVPLSNRLTESTMELLSTFVQKEILAARKKRRVQIAFFWVLLCLLGGAAFALGGLAVARFYRGTVGNPEADSPIIARLESLEIVGDFEFLTQVDNARLFPISLKNRGESFEPVPRLGPEVGHSVEMSRKPDSTELVLLQIRFYRLPEKEKKACRRLYNEMDASPNRAELFALLDEIERWFFFDLHETERDAWWTTPRDRRLSEMKRLIAATDRPLGLPEEGPPPSPGEKDRDRPDTAADGRRPRREGGIRRDGFFGRDIKRSLPEELRDENLGDIQNDFFTYLNETFNGQFPQKRKEEILFDFITAKGTDFFLQRLSEKGRKFMAPFSDDRKIRLIGLLILVDFHEKRFQALFPDEERNPAPPVDGRRPTGPGPFSEGSGVYWKTESTRELAETLKKLPEKIRDELLSLPDEEMYNQLLILHWGFDPTQVRSLGGPMSRFPTDFSPGPPNETTEEVEPRNPAENEPPRNDGRNNNNRGEGEMNRRREGFDRIGRFDRPGRDQNRGGENGPMTGPESWDTFLSDRNKGSSKKVAPPTILVAPSTEKKMMAPTAEPEKSPADVKPVNVESDQSDKTESDQRGQVESDKTESDQSGQVESDKIESGQSGQVESDKIESGQSGQVESDKKDNANHPAEEPKK